MDFRDSQFLKFGFDQDLIPKLNLRLSTSKKVKYNKQETNKNNKRSSKPCIKWYDKITGGL